MELTKKDIKTLINFGVANKEIEQIKECLKQTKFSSSKNRTIKYSTAIKYLGKKEFLSGMARCSFHWSAVRQYKDGSDRYVYFDSREYFIN